MSEPPITPFATVPGLEGDEAAGYCADGVCVVPETSGPEPLSGEDRPGS